MGLKSIWGVVGYSHNICATFAPDYIADSCRSHGLQLGNIYAYPSLYHRHEEHLLQQRPQVIRGKDFRWETSQFHHVHWHKKALSSIGPYRE